jgi:hypothetical protein
MDVNAGVIVHQVAHENEPFVNHGDEGIRATSPSVTIRNLLQQVRLFVERLPADFNVHAEVRADIEGGINVDELETARVFDFTAERTGFERGEDKLVITPNEFVGPAFDLPTAGIEAQFLVIAIFFARLVNMLQRLEREDGGADFAGFAIPDKFDFAFIIEKEEAVFVRKRFALLVSLMRSRFSESVSSYLSESGRGIKIIHKRVYGCAYRVYVVCSD